MLFLLLRGLGIVLPLAGAGIERARGRPDELLLPDLSPESGLAPLSTVDAVPIPPLFVLLSLILFP